MQDFAKQIEALGGHWEGIAGECLSYMSPEEA